MIRVLALILYYFVDGYRCELFFFLYTKFNKLNKLKIEIFKLI